MKHAVLVMGHGNLAVLKACMEVLDDKRFDFYIHIDKKSADSGCWLKNVCNKSNVFFTERIPVYWGHDSQTRAIALLLREVVNSNVDYNYLHLISSACFPLKTPQEIDAFFAENNGTEFVRYFESERKNGVHNWRMYYKYPYLKLYKRNKSELINNIQKLLYSRVIKLPRPVQLNIIKDRGWTVYAGDVWWSITKELAETIVHAEKEMMPYWEGCYVSDETFLQTQLKYLPQFLNKQSNYRTREIDWARGKPYVWQLDDFDELLQSTSLFARKFNPDDLRIVELLYGTLMSRKNDGL